MINAGKVVRQLELQLDDLQKYAADGELITLTQEQAKEIIALLKKKEPQKVINRYAKWNSVLMGNCPKCNAVLHEFDNAKACGVCGQAVKWE